MTCICITREQIGVGVPKAYGAWLAEDWKRDCPVHGKCNHDPKTGMCWNCTPPGHFRFSPEQIEENWRAYRERRYGRDLPGHCDAAPRDLTPLRGEIAVARSTSRVDPLEAAIDEYWEEHWHLTRAEAKTALRRQLRGAARS